MTITVFKKSSMGEISPTQQIRALPADGLLPVTIFVHQLEKYFFGQFPLWYSNLLNAKLSNRDFILIYGVGLFVFTFSYSPDTISGVVLFIPPGIIIFKKILPRLREVKKIIAIAIGVFVLFAVSMIAINI